MAGGACGWFGVGQAFGVLLLPGLGSAALALRFLGTQPPSATQALINFCSSFRHGCIHVYSFALSALYLHSLDC